MKQLDEIRTLIEPVINREGLILYELKFERVEGQRSLQVAICDENYNVDMDTCEKISDLISPILDEKDLIPESYFLDVCSPGAERELTTPQQIEQAAGEYIHIELKDPKDGFDMLEGTLTEVTPDEVVIEYRDKTKTKLFRADRANLKMIRLAVKV